MGVRALLWVVVIAFASPCVAGDVVLQTVPWPAARECTNCIPLQFGRLEMQLPRSEVSRILVIGRGDAVVSLVPSEGGIARSSSLHLVEQRTVLGRYAKTDLLQRYGVSTARDLYDLLGRPAAGDRMLKIAKDAELLESAVAYTLASKGALHAYRIECTEPELNRTYFVIDGDEGLYMLAGPVTQELHTAILSGLRVVEAP